MTRREYRKQLYTTIAVILIMALSLTAATYAWFNASASAAVTPLDLEIGGTAKLEIAITEDGIYGPKLAYSDIMQFVEALTKTDGLVPVSSADCQTFFGMGDVSAGQVTSFRLVKSEDGYYFEMPVYLRCESPSAVYLADDLKVLSPEGDFLDRAVRVGFVTEDITAIYEPNKADDMPGRGPTTAGDPGEGYAVTSVNGDFTPQNTVELSDISVPFDENDPQAQISLEGKTPLVRLEGGKPAKLTIYLWMEGMDYDAVKDIARNTLTVDLKFVGVSE